MSAQQHIEWLNLVEKTGPFLAVGVLEEAFPQGLDKVQTPTRQRIRSAYEEWREAVDEADPQLDSLHREWVRLVIEELLEYDATVLKPTKALPDALSYREPLTGAKVQPGFAVMADKARLLIACYAPDTDLSAPMAGESWAASPVERMIALCRATAVRVGLLTDGEQWTLVSVPPEGGSSIATWYARIWQQETVTLQAFVSLLQVRRSFGPADETLDALFQRSLEHQQELTDTLGEQVRRAVEVLVQALDRADVDRDRELLKDVSPAQLYEAGLTIMMRLVVLLCAEERKLLLLGEPIYDQHYAVSTLRSRLRDEKERFGDEVLERRHDAWSRLLAVFRAVFGGIEHETLRLPALGGSLFDPDRFPFLEGRAAGTNWREVPATPLPIDNRTVLMLLTALQVLEQRSGAQLLSYEALDVEQIGHVYEGLLERTVRRVPETTLGLIGSQKVVNPNIPLRELEAANTAGEEKLLAYLVEKTGRSEPALKNALAKKADDALYHRVLFASDSDSSLADRIKPFVYLVRTDSWGDPLAYRKDSFIVTLGVGRRETGTHYTPKSLTEPIVQHTLEPLAYFGPAEGKPPEEWRLKSPAQLLALKICDMAMGSGAFLVQTCRWLGERLVEAWDADEKAGRVISIEGVVLDQAGDAELLPRDQAERVLIARRLIASRCLYGVDINPMAVELAKLSLWLVTMMRNRPFSFLDHALKCGDSLLGVAQSKQLERFSLREPDRAQPLLETANLWRHIEQAAVLRRELEATPNHTAAQIAEKARLHAQAESLLAKLRAAADFLVAVEFNCPDGRGWETRRAVAAGHMQSAWKKEIGDFQRLSRAELRGRRPFHWPLEFPEVFEAGERGDKLIGFDAFVFNPPFRSGSRISSDTSDDYFAAIKRQFPASGGNTDLCCYFIHQATKLINSRTAALGFIATNSVSQGDNRSSLLSPLVGAGWSIPIAFADILWPGSANLFVSWLVLTPLAWPVGKACLNGVAVDSIDAALTANKPAPEAFELAANEDITFKGVEFLGDGFKLPDPQGREFYDRYRDRNIVKPWLNGADLTDGPDLPFRFAIDFADMDADEARKHRDCFEIVERLVKPVRANDNRPARRERWWQFGEKAMGMRKGLTSLKRALVRPFTSDTFFFEFVSTKFLFTNALIVVCRDDFDTFALLNSTIHELWARDVGSSLKMDFRYTPSKCFQTFPFPPTIRNLGTKGEAYYKRRRDVIEERREGLTDIYKRFHDVEQTADDIAELRELHRQLDTAVAAAYDWNDLAADEGAALRHDFHETKQGMRWTLHPDVRRDILNRLLALNHQRHAEEVATGPHKKKRPAAKRKPESGSESSIADLL